MHSAASDAALGFLHGLSKCMNRIGKFRLCNRGIDQTTNRR